MLGCPQGKARWEGSLGGYTVISKYEGRMSSPEDDNRRICEWCSNYFTHTQHGRGQPPRYCCDDCRKAARRSLNVRAVHAYRAKKGATTAPAAPQSTDQRKR